MKKKLTISLCTALLLCVLFSFTSVFAAGDQRVYDFAGLFTQAEVQELEESVTEHRKSTQMDIVIVTTKNTLGKTTQAYADDFYDDKGFGEGSDNTGVLLLIDMDHRVAYMSTTGKAIQKFPDDTIHAITDKVASCLGDGEYAQGARVFLKEVEDWVNPNILGAVIVCLIIGVIGGVIAVVVVWRKYTHGYKADQYVLSDNSNTRLTSRDDVFLHKRVVTHTISNNSGSGGGGGSSTHTSSSGTSHGGGGSSF